MIDVYKYTNQDVTLTDAQLFNTLIHVYCDNAWSYVIALPTAGDHYLSADLLIYYEGSGDLAVAGTTLTDGDLLKISYDIVLHTWRMIHLSRALHLGETSTEAFRGDYGRLALNHAYSTHADPSHTEAAFTHSQSAHAPSNAQKNSDITKSEIEAKLTGEITTHTHPNSGGGGTLTTWYEPLVVEDENGEPQILFSEGDIVMVEVGV